MTTLPTWAVWAVSLGTPISAFVGVLLGQLVTRKGAQELEKRSKREETMRLLRWAAELAVSEEPRMNSLGVAELGALLTSDLLDDTEKGFVEAALADVYEEPEAALDEFGDEGEAIEYVADDVVGLTDELVVEVSSDRGTGGFTRWLRSKLQ